jgi:hypothetical protein
MVYIKISLVELGKIIFAFAVTGLEIATAKAGDESTQPVPNERKPKPRFQLEKNSCSILILSVWLY